MAWPNCRDVVASAAATPACSRGMPETAAFVIGALTKPKPIPNTTYAASSQANDVCGPTSTSIAQATIAETPAMTSGVRGPRRPTMRPETGERITVIRAIGTMAMPASIGESPRTSCR